MGASHRYTGLMPPCLDDPSNQAHHESPMTHAANPSPDLEARILAEASALFRTRGYEATSVREVAEAVGILPGSLHYRFPTKAHMLIAIARKAVDEMSEAVAGVRARTDDPIRRIELSL